MQIVHMGTKEYTCTICSKSFGKPYMLRRHISTHTGTHGDKELKTKSNIAIWYTLDLFFAGEKPHECEICGNHFTQLSSLKSHMNIHNKTKK